MAKKKKLEERIRSEHNRSLFEKYVLYLEYDKVDDAGNKPLPSTCKTYRDNAVKFVEYIDKLGLDADALEIEDLLDYLKLKYSGNSTNMRNNYYAAADFLGFVNPSLASRLDISMVNQFAGKNNQDTARSRAANVLTVAQIDRLRNKLSALKRWAYLFAFELAYLHGLNPEQLSQCTEENYDFETQSFRIDGELVPVDPVISEIIEKNPKKVLKKVDEHQYKSYYFPAMGKLIGEPMKWLDISETRKSFFKCPICHEAFPPEERYWTLAVREDDENQTHWIVCTRDHTEDKCQ